MPVITAIVGLPASGRMYYARQRQKTEGGAIVELTYGDTTADRELLLNLMMNGRDLFFIDATLCDDRTKSDFKLFVETYPEYELKWVYFDHRMRTCLNNAQIPSPRHYKKLGQHIRGAAAMYKIPEGVERIPVFDQMRGKIDQ